MVATDGLYTLFTIKTYQMCVNIIAFPNCINDLECYFNICPKLICEAKINKL